MQGQRHPNSDLATGSNDAGEHRATLRLLNTTALDPAPVGHRCLANRRGCSSPELLQRPSTLYRVNRLPGRLEPGCNPVPTKQRVSVQLGEPTETPSPATRYLLRPVHTSGSPGEAGHMGSLENYHRAIVERCQAGTLELGISRMSGTEPQSIAFSKFWTTMPVLAVLFCIASPWLIQTAYAWGLFIIAPGVFVVGVLIRRDRGMARARRLAVTDPLAFAQLWDEGALSLRLTGSEECCVSPNGDYRLFIFQNFLSPARPKADDDFLNEGSG